MNYDNVISTLESALTPTFFVTYPQYTPLLYYVRVVILKTFKKSPFLCKSSEAPLPPSRCLHIGNVPVNINENQLLTELEEFGEVETLRIISQKNRRFAFVTYSSLELAVSAKQAIIDKQRKSHVQSWKSAVSFAHQESFTMHPHKARTPTLEPNPSSVASMASGYTTASSVGSVYPTHGPTHTAFGGYGERARDQSTCYHPHSTSSKSCSSTDSVAYTPRSTADGHDNSFSQPKQLNSYISQFDTRPPYGAAPPGFSNQNNSLFASNMPYSMASHNSLSSLPSPPRYQPQVCTPKGYDKHHSNSFHDSSMKSRSYSGSSLSSPSASPSLWAQCPVLRYLCDSSYHANQSWPCCLAIDSPYCDLLASVLRRQGGRMYIRELAEHLQRELNITQAIAGIPLKSFLIAYPSRFLVQGDFVIDAVSLSFLKQQQQQQQQVSPNKDSSSITALPPSLFQSERSQSAQSNQVTTSFPMSVIHRPTPVFNRPATVFSALTQGTDSGPYSPPSYNTSCTPITAMHPQHPSFAGDAGHLKSMLEFMEDEFFI